MTGWFHVKSDDFLDDLSRWITVPIYLLGEATEEAADAYREHRKRKKEEALQRNEKAEKQISKAKEQPEKSFLILGFNGKKQTFKIEADPHMTLEDVAKQVEEKKLRVDAILLTGLDKNKEVTDKVQIPYPAIDLARKNQMERTKKDMDRLRGNEPKNIFQDLQAKARNLLSPSKDQNVQREVKPPPEIENPLKALQAGINPIGEKELQEKTSELEKEGKVDFSLDQDSGKEMNPFKELKEKTQELDTNNLTQGKMSALDPEHDGGNLNPNRGETKESEVDKNAGSVTNNRKSLDFDLDL